MNLVTVKELYKTPEAYLDKEITLSLIHIYTGLCPSRTSWSWQGERGP